MKHMKMKHYGHDTGLKTSMPSKGKEPSGFVKNVVKSAGNKSPKSGHGKMSGDY